MSRSGYSEDCERWDLIRWRGAVASAINGKRGQKLLSDMLTALDAMPDKKLIAEYLETSTGDVCALGCLGKSKQIDMSNLDPDDYDRVAEAFGVAPALVQEIAFENDYHYERRTPEQRWMDMRKWVSKQLRPTI